MGIEDHRTFCGMYSNQKYGYVKERHSIFVW